MRLFYLAKEEEGTAEHDDDGSVSRAASVQETEKLDRPGSAGSGVGREKTEVSRVSALGKRKQKGEERCRCRNFK